VSTDRARVRAALLRLAVLAFAALILLLPVGRLPVWSDNEARYMVLARDILEHGRWLMPELRGAPHVNKPQLFIWAIAVTSLPGGRVTEWTAGLPAALSSFAAVAGVLAVGTRAWGPTVGLVAALVLTTMAGFVVVATRVLPDVMVMAWATWALYWLLRARLTAWRTGPVLAFWTCVAGAALTKGLPGFVALAAGLVAVVATCGRDGLRRLRPAVGLALVGLLTAPWWVTFLTREPAAVMRHLVINEYATWLVQRGLPMRLESLWILGYTLPWSLFLIAALVWWRGTERDEPRRLIGWWALSTWALIGLSGVQRVHYWMPAYPALALLVAEFVVRARDARGATLLRRATLGPGGLLLVVAVLVVTPVLSRIEGYARSWVPTGHGEAWLIASMLLAAAVVAVVAARRGSFVVAAAALALGVGGVLVDEGFRYPARFTRDYDVRPQAEAARRLTPPGAPVPTYGGVWLCYDFYLARPVIEIDEPEVRRILASPPTTALLLSPASWAKVQSSAAPAWRVVAVGPPRHARKTLVLGGTGDARQ
jgi:4-amino-4-deoxy-L-arabinose transferase-like glycosyltransferase